MPPKWWQQKIQKMLYFYYLLKNISQNVHNKRQKCKHCKNQKCDSGVASQPVWYPDGWPVAAGHATASRFHDDITIFSKDLEENDIESIDQVELKFHIYNADSYSTIADSDPITFTAE